jgi:hypothetical protein
MTGSMAVIMPACEAEVFTSAADSKRKYRHGSHASMNRIRGMSSSLAAFGRMSPAKGTKARAAMAILAKFTIIGW